MTPAEQATRDQRIRAGLCPDCGHDAQYECTCNERVYEDPVGIAQYKSVPMGRRLAHERFYDRFKFAPGLGWLRWDGCRWKPTTDHWPMREAADWIEDVLRAMLDANEDAVVVNQVASYRDDGRLRSLLAGAKTADTLVDLNQLDARPHLLNCPNGVVDLRTGKLRPSDPLLLLTRVTAAEYEAGYTHPDWTQALEALPESSREYAQQRLGQAITGDRNPNGEVVIAYGRGENGKTAILGAVNATAGDYSSTISHRVLHGNPGDHPTELMTLKGLRLALVEETPENRRLNVNRLKKITDTDEVSARRMRQDDVTFAPSHSMFVTTNHRPVVEEQDHATWRRLWLLPFPYRFRKPGEPVEDENDKPGDPGLKQRLVATDSKGQRACLAWLVEGAVAYYQANRTLPPPPEELRRAWEDWRSSVDLPGMFATERLVFDAGACVLSQELLEEFNRWLGENGHQRWSSQLLSSRIESHDLFVDHKVRHEQTRALDGLSMRTPASTPKRARVYRGVRWRTAADA